MLAWNKSSLAKPGGYRSYAKEQAQEDRSKYEQTEFEAKIHRNGLWAGTNPVPPWDFRRDKR